jgi:hypothetical protein
VIKGLHIVVVKGEKSGSGTIVMQYLNYEEDIVKKARLKLVGWPPDVEFCKPGVLDSVIQGSTRNQGYNPRRL